MQLFIQHIMPSIFSFFTWFSAHKGNKNSPRLQPRALHSEHSLQNCVLNIFIASSVKLLQGRSNWPESLCLALCTAPVTQPIHFPATRRISLQTHLSALTLGLLGCKWNRFLFKPPSKSVIIHKSAHKCFGN